MFSNIDEDYQLVSQEKSEDSEKNDSQEFQHVRSVDDVSINMVELAVSSPPSNSRDNSRKMKDILAQTMTQTCKVLEEIELSHKEEIFRLNSELENLRNQNLELELNCQTLEHEKIRLVTEMNKMKSAMKQLVSNFSE